MVAVAVVKVKVKVKEVVVGVVKETTARKGNTFP